LLSHIDQRQRATLFRYAYDYTKRTGYQYIVSVNETQLQSIKNQIPSDEFLKLFNDETIILTLTDESAETKLLGIQVDLEYD
jgi:uncharacterized protein YydD (DUF2326 family)